MPAGRVKPAATDSMSVLRGLLHAPLHVAHRGEVLVQLAAVVAAQSLIEARGIAAHEIQDAAAPLQLRLAAGGIQRIAITEQPLEYIAWIDADGHGLRRAAPGQRVGVSAAVVDVAAAQQLGVSMPSSSEGSSVLSAKWLATTWSMEMPHWRSEPFSRLRRDAGEEGRAGFAMATRPHGLAVREAADHREPVLAGCERRQCRDSGKSWPARAGREVLHDHAVGHVQGLQALRSRGDVRCAGAGKHGFQQRQCHDRAQATQHGAAIQWQARAPAHDSGTWRRLNGTLCTMPRITLRTR